MKESVWKRKSEQDTQDFKDGQFLLEISVRLFRPQYRRGLRSLGDPWIVYIVLGFIYITYGLYLVTEINFIFAAYCYWKVYRTVKL